MSGPFEALVAELVKVTASGAVPLTGVAVIAGGCAGIIPGLTMIVAVVLTLVLSV